MVLRPRSVKRFNSESRTENESRGVHTIIPFNKYHELSHRPWIADSCLPDGIADGLTAVMERISRA